MKREQFAIMCVCLFVVLSFIFCSWLVWSPIRELSDEARKPIENELKSVADDMAWTGGECAPHADEANEWFEEKRTELNAPPMPHLFHPNERINMCDLAENVEVLIEAAKEGNRGPASTLDAGGI